jgi:putative transcriptional regulator
MASLAGSFLVARAVLRDSSFRQTVVLLLDHGDDGAFGLVVNRPAAVEGLPFAVFTGGPCESNGLLMLHGHAEWVKLSLGLPGGEVAPGVFQGDASCLGRLNDPPAGQVLRYRMFTGYSGWGAGQLEGELAAGDWAVVPATAQLLFDTPVEELWDRLVPPAIPQPSLN